MYLVKTDSAGEVYGGKALLSFSGDERFLSDDSIVLCSGNSFTLSTNPSASYLWSNGDTSQSITVNTSGNYFVTTIDSNGNTATSDTIKVIVYPTPNFYIYTSNNDSTDITLCDSSLTLFAVSSDSSVTYNWYSIDEWGNDYSFSNNSNVTIDTNSIYLLEYDGFINHFIRLKVTNQYGCYMEGVSAIYDASGYPDPYISDIFFPYSWYVNGDTVTIRPGDSVKMEPNGYFDYCYWSPDIWLSDSSDCETVAKPLSSITYQLIVKNWFNGECSQDVRDVTIIICSSVFTAIDTIINIGDSIKVGNNIYKTTGTYSDTLMAANGCDSIVTTNLTVLPNSSFSQNPTICDGQSVTVDSNTYTVSGNYSDTLTAANGCDSIVTTNLTVNPTDSITLNDTIIQGGNIKIGDSTFTTAGTYMVTMKNSDNCDSIITLNLTVLTGIQSSMSNSQFAVSIFPNPFSNTATLRITNFAELRITNAELRIYNLLGQEVHPAIIRNSDSFVISRSNLVAGIYFYQLEFIFTN